MWDLQSLQALNAARVVREQIEESENEAEFEQASELQEQHKD